MNTTSSDTGRIRINLSLGELEIEGTEAFVSQYADSIEAIVERLRSEAISPPAKLPPLASDAGTIRPSTTASSDEPFGEILHALASKSGTDQILLSGYYVAKDSAEGTFSTSDAHQLLIEQGVKLSNASQSMKNNLTSKRVFKVGNRFKVARTGLDHLKALGVSVS
jgi:hypothetical protein